MMMETPQNFIELQKSILQFNQRGKYLDSLALLDSRRALVERPDVYYLWRSLLLVLSNDQQGAIRTLREALDQSIWWPPVLLQDEPDFEPLIGNPEFEDLVHRCTEFYDSSRRQAQPFRVDMEPVLSSTPPPYPLIMAMHGRGENIHSNREKWETVRKKGMFLSLIGSSQVMGQDIFNWDNRSVAENEVKYHFTDLCRQDSLVDTRRTILAGFSQAGGLVIRLVLNEILPVNRFIAVCPATLCDDDFDHFSKSTSLSAKRAVIITGSEDHPWKKTSNRLAVFLKQRGTACLFVSYPGLGHGFPPDFTDQLPEYLSFLSEEKSQ